MVDSAAEARLRAEARAKSKKMSADADPLAALQKDTTKSKSAEEKVTAAKKESELARADQLKTQREARDLAERLGAKVDTATGIIDPETVTTPFNVYPVNTCSPIAKLYWGQFVQVSMY